MDGLKKDLALKLYGLRDKNERLYEECMRVLPRDIREDVFDAMQLMRLMHLTPRVMSATARQIDAGG